MAASDVEVLTNAYRQAQFSRASALAAFAGWYFLNKVNAEDEASIERWLDLILPRLLAEHNTIASLSASYATELRKIEVPKAPALTFTPSVGATSEQLKTSLMVQGPVGYLNKARDIRTLEAPPLREQALLAEAKQISSAQVAAAAVRHVQNGGRQTLVDAAQSDRVALGYVRVTKDKPCFFCAMLASRGLVFSKDSFAASDPRFLGPGEVKVHDSCACTMKPVYTRKGDPFLAKAQVFEDQWATWGAGGGDALLRFRRGYEHWSATGETLDWDVVNNDAKFRARNSAA